MKLFKSSLIALALTSATTAYAESIAITNATVHTVTEQGVLENATVVFNDGVITAINPESHSADTVIDAQGKTLTPGLIASMNQLGLVEVNAVSRTRDAGEKKADITFDASSAFNPKSAAVPYSRKGGITTNVVVPSGGDNMFKGQAFYTDLSGEFDSVLTTKVATILDLGAKSKGSRAQEIQKLRNKFEDAKKKLAKASKESNKEKDKKKSAKEPKRDELIINALLAGKSPLIAYVDRATDILAVLALKKDFGVDVVISGGGDAVSVASEIAKANVTVIINAASNLPSFDAIHKDLNLAAELFSAGVTVAYAPKGDASTTHSLNGFRFDAGISIANGVSRDNALAALTANVADVFGLNSGKIAIGKRADLVLWSGDPFELSTRVDTLWISGEKSSTRSRQDELRDRYTAESDMPRAYTK